MKDLIGVEISISRVSLAIESVKEKTMRILLIPSLAVIALIAAWLSFHGFKAADGPEDTIGKANAIRDSLIPAWEKGEMLSALLREGMDPSEVEAIMGGKPGNWDMEGFCCLRYLYPGYGVTVEFTGFKVNSVRYDPPAANAFNRFFDRVAALFSEPNPKNSAYGLNR